MSIPAHSFPKQHCRKSHDINHFQVAPRLHLSRLFRAGEVRQSRPELQEVAMQFVITALAVIAGMVFSLAIALLAEELIFGKVFGFFLNPHPIPAKPGAKR